MIGLHVSRNLVPYAETGKEIMLIANQHYDATSATAWASALEPNTVIQLLAGQGPNTDSYTLLSTLSLSERGQKGKLLLPDGSNVSRPVTALRIISGSAAVSIESPYRIKMEFRTRKHP